MKISKSAAAGAALDPAVELEAINRQTLTPLTAEDVFVFRVTACDDQVDRDWERFPVPSLEKLAHLFVGKPVIADHKWSAEKQQARIYAGGTEAAVGVTRLVLRCYMLRTEGNKETIAAIEGGILREVSVGCAVSRVTCSVCGEEYSTCGHQKGETYDGKTCVANLEDPVDAYELSFVAVPAQPGAGVTKQYNGWTEAERETARLRLEIEHERWI